MFTWFGMAYTASVVNCYIIFTTLCTSHRLQMSKFHSLWLYQVTHRAAACHLLANGIDNPSVRDTTVRLFRIGWRPHLSFAYALCLPRSLLLLLIVILTFRSSRRLSCGSGDRTATEATWIVGPTIRRRFMTP